MTFLPHYSLDQREEFLAYVGAMDDTYLAYFAENAPSRDAKPDHPAEGAQR